MNPTRWVALHCGEEAETLLARHPNAFLLLCQIAMRARWKDCPITKLKTGEAFIGDWKTAGLHSEKAYQVAKKRLDSCGLVSFQGGNKGTVAKLAGSTIFSLSQSIKGEPEDRPAADKGRPKGDQGATIHTEHKEYPDTLTPFSEEKSAPPAFSLSEENAQPPDLPGIVAIYPRRENVKQALEHLAASIKRGADPESILAGTRAIAAVIPQLPSGHLNAYVLSASNFFKDERWRDDPGTWLRNAGSKNGAALKPLDLGGRRRADVFTSPT